MAYVNRPGYKIYWEEQGMGPPILFIMGLGFTHQMWFRVLPHVLRAGFRAILFDNRGMGRSDAPSGPYSVPGMAFDAMAVLDSAGIQAAHVVGASMGGMIAQEIAIRFPERVLSLILGCTTSGGLFGKWPHWAYRPKAETWANGTRLERERALRHMLYADTTSLDLIEEDLRIRSSCIWNSAGFLNQLAGLLLWNSYWRLPRIEAPTMVIHGDQDHLVPPENGRKLAARIPGARFYLVQNAGHILTTDQTEESCGVLIDFLHQQVKR